MKWSLFSWKKPAELAPGDYQQVKTNVNNNTTAITNLRNLLTTTQNDLNNVKANYLTTNTEQTITSVKTFNAGPVGLKLKQAAGRDDKQYLIFANKDNTTTFSLGSDLSGTNFELNRGHLRIQAKEANKNVYFDAFSRVEFNNTVPQFGQNITAGWGGGVCKFLPEDNSTKTLQFFETNNTSQRRFNLKVAEPTEANNPATKQYVDNAISGVSNANLQNQLNTLTTNVENSIGYHIRVQELHIRNNNGLINTTETANSIIYTYKITSVNEYQILSANLRGNFQSLPDNAMINLVFSFSTVGNNIYFNIIKLDKNSGGFPLRDNCFIRIFYVDNLTSRTDNPFYFDGGK